MATVGAGTLGRRAGQVGLELREELFHGGAVLGDEGMDTAAETSAIFLGQVFRRDDNHRGVDIARIATEVIEEENLLEHATHLGEVALRRLRRMKEEHKIIGDVRAIGCLMGIELVKDRATKEPFNEAGKLIYQKEFRKGLAWIPAGHILRMSPPIVMDEDTLLKGLDIIDEAIGETAKELKHT